ncbi:MAG: hypothetical protein ACYC6M_02955 [Terriglobales bacterium]
MTKTHAIHQMSAQDIGMTCCYCDDAATHTLTTEPTGLVLCQDHACGLDMGVGCTHRDGRAICPECSAALGYTGKEVR